MVSTNTELIVARYYVYICIYGFHPWLYLARDMLTHKVVDEWVVLVFKIGLNFYPTCTVCICAVYIAETKWGNHGAQTSLVIETHSCIFLQEMVKPLLFCPTLNVRTTASAISISRSKWAIIIRSWRHRFPCWGIADRPDSKPMVEVSLVTDNTCIIYGLAHGAAWLFAWGE